MTDETRKALTEYCPEIIHLADDPGLSDQERLDLIAAAIIRRIKERGEDRKFVMFLQQRGYATIHPPFISAGKERYLIDWELTDPTTLIRVVGEWVGRKE